MRADRGADMSTGTPQAPASVSPEERRWLHDKYERLAGDEAQLADSRTSYFAAISSALVAALVILVVNELKVPSVFVVMTSLLASFGMLISIVWTVVLHRTTAAQVLWRDAALALEQDAPPIAVPLPGMVVLPAGRSLQVDLTRPYLAHKARFTEPGLPWVDRVKPSELSANVPLILVVLWSLVLLGVWTWFLFLQ
ncbi:MAG: hypothetical protein L3K06_01075 [Thermoplasmata archaeon]|nr:hypothetical protein [Thermoplasmata archaeon]